MRKHDQDDTMGIFIALLIIIIGYFLRKFRERLNKTLIRKIL